MEAEEPSDGRVEESDYHLHRNRGGHWWLAEDAEVPEYYRQKYEETTRRVADHCELPPEHQPDVPDDWDPSDYTAYYCGICRESCINPTDSVYTRQNECRHCFALPSLD